MTNKNKKRSRQGMVSKVANALLIALGFSRAIQLALTGNINGIIFESTFGLAGEGGGEFDLAAGLRMYAPAGAAVGLGALKRHLMKKFPVR